MQCLCTLYLEVCVVQGRFLHLAGFSLFTCEAGDTDLHGCWDEWGAGICGGMGLRSSQPSWVPFQTSHPTRVFAFEKMQKGKGQCLTLRLELVSQSFQASGSQGREGTP